MSQKTTLPEEVKVQEEKRMEMLKGRAKRCVCKYCGQALKVKRIIFASFGDAKIEMFCEHCGRIEFGVEPEIYKSAKFFVEETGSDFYTDIEDTQLKKEMSIAKVCEIMSWGAQALGILSPQGFRIEIDTQQTFLNECMVLSEQDMALSEAELKLKFISEWGK